MAEGEDPFGSLIKLCRPTASQELKLLTCPFTGESETFPVMDSDSYSDFDFDFDFETSSLPPTPSDVTGIRMVSPPESDSEKDSSAIDKNTPPGNEVFQTPPEHHNRRSSSSSQEFLSQRETPVPAVADDDRVDLGLGQNLGFMATEDLNGVAGDLGADCWGNVNEVEGMVGFETELKRFEVFEDEMGGAISKKIRVSEENWDWDTLCADQTGMSDKVDCTEVSELDCEEIYEGLALDKGKVAVDGDSSVKDSDDNGRSNSTGLLRKSSGLVLDGETKALKASQKSQNVSSDDVPNERMEEKAVKGDRVERCPKNNVDLAPGKAAEGKDSGTNEGITMTNVASYLVENSAISKHGEVLENVVAALEGTGKFNDFSSDGGIEEKAKSGEICITGNVDMPVKASVEKARIDNHLDMRKDGEGPSGSKSTEEIESFTCEGHRSYTNLRAKERVYKRGRELPLSIRGKENDTEGEDKRRKMIVKKGSWQELIDALEVVVKKVDEGLEDVDFLETAKRRGLTFPQPRWF